MKEGLAKTDISTEAPEHTVDDGDKTARDNDVPVAAQVVAVETKKASTAEEPIDPVAARRAAELAELREIEASEELRRSEENKKHADAQAARNQTNNLASREATTVNKFSQLRRRFKVAAAARLKKWPSPPCATSRGWPPPPIRKNHHYTGIVW